jgi:hypothetical protein
VLVGSLHEVTGELLAEVDPQAELAVAVDHRARLVGVGVDLALVHRHADHEG